MKKILFLVLISLVFSTSAFALSTITGSTTIGNLDFSVSNNVQISIDSNADFYTAESLHTSGSRVFLTDSVESKIYWKDATTFDTVAAAAENSAAGTHGSPDPTSGTTWTGL